MAIEKQYDSQHFLVKSINILLETIGELPISTLEDVENILEAQIAESVIIESKMSTLALGWDVNTDTNYEFIPDENNAIVIPPHALDIRSGADIVLRDWKLYNKATHSRIFTEPVKCDVVWNLDFDTLPHPLRYYITIKAARIFQARMISDKSMYAFTQEDEKNALIGAKQSNGFTGAYNMLDSDYSNNFKVL